MTEHNINVARSLVTVSGFDLEAVKGEIEKVLPGTKVPGDSVEATALLLTLSRPRSQPEFSALAINLSGGKITGKELTASLKVAFPNAKIGDRHGPHYLSKARTGKLAGTDIRPEFSRRSSKRDLSPAEIEAEINKLKALLKSKSK